jgi:hypothetical protein
VAAQGAAIMQKVVGHKNVEPMPGDYETAQCLSSWLGSDPD